MSELLFLGVQSLQNSHEDLCVVIVSLKIQPVIAYTMRLLLYATSGTNNDP